MQHDNGFNDTRDHLAQMLLEMGNPGEAQQVLDAALAIAPERVSSRHLLGLAFAAQQEFARAIACWELLIDREDTPPETFHLLANAYLQINERSRALQVLQLLVTDYPHFIEGQLQLALLLLENGEFTQGWRHLDLARALDPHNPAVQQLLDTANAMRESRE